MSGCLIRGKEQISQFEFTNFQAARYSGTFDAILKILKQEGPLALYNGLEATVWRHAAWNGGYFGVIFGVRDFLPTPKVKYAMNFSFLENG